MTACGECGQDVPEVVVKRSCNGCEFAVFNDYGYSNYTVEGTEFFCSLRFHPADGFDRWFGKDDRLNFADECVMYTEGEPITMDVDRDGMADLTPKQRILFDRALTR